MLDNFKLDTFAGDSDNLSGFPSLTNVIALALNLYDDMQMSQLDNHVFYPQLKFKCSGNITKITFIGERRIPPMDVEKYLQFRVWSAATQDDNTIFRLNDLNKYTLLFDLTTSTIIATGSGGSSIYEVVLGENESFSFKNSDVFGIRQSDSNRSKVTLLHQSGGGLSYHVELESSNYHNQVFTASTLTETNIYPLIAIETGK